MRVLLLATLACSLDGGARSQDGRAQYDEYGQELRPSPLAGLDRDLTLRLNRQRGVKFEFPQ
jgi:hypothetical protein